MSLTERLSRLEQDQGEADAMSAFKEMTLEEMGHVPVTFGKTHMGKSFMEIWTLEEEVADVVYQDIPDVNEARTHETGDLHQSG